MARILAVDDEEPVLAIVKRMLTVHEHTVDTAGDGAEALDRLEKAEYDLLLIDHYMPRLSGIEAVAIIRSSRKFDRMKILMMTSTSVTKDVDAAYKSGIDGYIVKPFEIDKFVEKVAQLLPR